MTRLHQLLDRLFPHDTLWTGWVPWREFTAERDGVQR